MLVHAIAAVAASALTLVSGSSTSNFSITASNVELTTRADWCTSQTNVCTEVCSSSSAKSNTCSPDDLTYNCTCTDGTDPDMNEYLDSLPYYICEEAADECIKANVGDSTGQSNCTKSIRDNCGTKTAGASTATTTSAASSSGTGTAATGSATSSAKTTTATTSSSTAGAMPTSIQFIGNGAAAVAVGLFAYML